MKFNSEQLIISQDVLMKVWRIAMQSKGPIKHQAVNQLMVFYLSIVCQILFFFNQESCLLNIVSKFNPKKQTNEQKRIYPEAELQSRFIMCQNSKFKFFSLNV